MRRGIGALLLCVLAGCGGGPTAENTGPSDSTYEMLARDFVRSKLRDPESAKFSEVRVSRKIGHPVTCGRVNAKNGLGGMTGAQRFISGGEEATITEEDMEPEEFAKSWTQMC